MKLTNIYKQILNEQSDCSNLFTDSSDNSNHRMAIGNDLYYYVIKQISVKRELMSPDSYFDVLGGLEQHTNNIDVDDVKKKVDMLKQGVKLDIPYLKFNQYGSNTGHEGRHRTLAAKELGCHQIPVIIERAISIDDIMALANKIGHLEQDDMISELKKLGFKNFDNIDGVQSVLRLSKEKGKYYKP